MADHNYRLNDKDLTPNGIVMMQWNSSTGLITPIGVNNPLPIASSNSGAGSPTDRSVALTLGNTAQQLMAANTSRKKYRIQNIDTSIIEDIWVNDVGGTAAANTIGSLRIQSGAYFETESTSAVSVVAATTGHKITASEI